MARGKIGTPIERPTEWWLQALRQRAERMYEEQLDWSQPIEFVSETEREGCIRFFNAAYRAEESGKAQALALAEEVRAWDPELSECLTLYGNEEGWHRELLTEFLGRIGGGVRPMGRMTGTLYRLYGRAKSMETIMLTNLMFETIGSTTYRLALRNVRQPTVRQLLQILTRDESFHVPLNVHFIRQVLKRQTRRWGQAKLQTIYHAVFLALIGSAYKSRKAAQSFDQLSFRELATAYVENLGRLFLSESDLDFRPLAPVLWAFGLSSQGLRQEGGPAAISVAAAAAAARREEVAVTVL